MGKSPSSGNTANSVKGAGRLLLSKHRTALMLAPGHLYWHREEQGDQSTDGRCVRGLR